MSAGPGKIRVLAPDRHDEVAPADLPPLLAHLRKPASPVTWVHMEPHEAVFQALDDMGLDEVAVKSLREGPERPRAEEFADHLYVSLFLADKKLGGRGIGERESLPGGQGSGLPRLRELRLFLGPNWIISVGHIDDSDYEILAERMRRQVFSRQRGASFIAYHICEWLVERLQPALERLDGRIDALEDQVVLSKGDSSMQELFNLKRDLVDLRRRVAPLRDVMQRLGSHGVMFIESEVEVYFRDVHDDVMRGIELLDTYRDILSSALDLHLSSVSNRLNRVMKQLTVVATVFMPLSFIVGLFGTNFRDMPFGSLAWFIVMFALLFGSLVAMVVYTRWRT